MKIIRYILVAALGATSLMMSALTPEKPDRLKVYETTPGVFRSVENRTPVTIYLRQHPDSVGTVRYRTSPAIASRMKINVVNNHLVVDMDKPGKDEAEATGKFLKYMTVYTSSPLERLVVTGSGDLNVPAVAMAPDVEVSLTGSGDIDLTDCKAESINVKLIGSGDIDFHGITAVRALHLSLRGSGDIDVASLKADSISAGLNGSGDIGVKGEVRSASFALSGSGDIDADGLKADGVTVSLNGSGDIDCCAREAFAGAATGSGEVTVYGKPAYVKISGNKKSITIK